MPKNFSPKIKEHYHYPLNTGKLSGAKVFEGTNPLCGDEIKVYLKIEKSKIKNCRYEARGCMITIAAASVLSEYLKGKPIKTVKKITKKDIDKLLGVKISRARESCETLALSAIKKSLS